MSCRDSVSFNLSTLACRTDSHYEGGPIGEPRRVNPSCVIGMSTGNGEVEASTEVGINRRDLLLLRWRPTGGPSVSMILRARFETSLAWAFD